MECKGIFEKNNRKPKAKRTTIHANTSRTKRGVSVTIVIRTNGNIHPENLSVNVLG